MRTYVTLPLGRGVERQFFGAWALCSSPLAEEETFFLRQLSLVPLAIMKTWAPLGAGVTSAIAPLPEPLPGLVEGSLRPQSSFEYMCLAVNSL